MKRSFSPFLELAQTLQALATAPRQPTDAPRQPLAAPRQGPVPDSQGSFLPFASGGK